MQEFYEGREQSLVKHYILQKYIERFAHIVGTWAESITYVDCFSGPWNVASKDLSDSSFSIALQQLRRARETLQSRGKELKIRSFFLEEHKNAYAALKQFADSVSDAEVATKNAKLENSINDILGFIAADRESFPFIFIDPTGWTGFERSVISPLLRVQPSEVLINFMTGHVRRFIAHPDQSIQKSFQAMYGPYRPDPALIQAASEEDRDDLLIASYSKMVRETGEFPYVCNAIILHPEVDATKFHLIYATRSLKGVEVFKDAERAAMGVQSTARAQAKARKEEKRTSQPSLFAPEILDDNAHMNTLTSRYVTRAKARVLDALSNADRARYDDLWALALSEPLVQESDLKEWLNRWSERRLIELHGMQPRQRVPQMGQGIIVVRVVSSDSLRQRA